MNTAKIHKTDTRYHKLMSKVPLMSNTSGNKFIEKCKFS